jgi:hypothetical protein
MMRRTPCRDERMECMAIDKREGAKLRFERRRRMRVFCCMGQNNYDSFGLTQTNNGGDIYN